MPRALGLILPEHAAWTRRPVTAVHFIACPLCDSVNDNTQLLPHKEEFVLPDPSEPAAPQARAPPARPAPPAPTHGSIAAPRARCRHLLRTPPPWHSRRRAAPSACVTARPPRGPTHVTGPAAPRPRGSCERGGRGSYGEPEGTRGSGGRKSGRDPSGGSAVQLIFGEAACSASTRLVLACRALQVQNPSNTESGNKLERSQRSPSPTYDLAPPCLLTPWHGVPRQSFLKHP